MEAGSFDDPLFNAWLAALERRHLADLTASEIARALRALSSCYVERRAKLAEGGALATAGKRAAFALFYAPVHFLIVRQIVRTLDLSRRPVRHIHDLGCGTGSAGAAWALELDRARVSGVDRHPWVVAEANRTYRELGIEGRAEQRDLLRVRITPSAATGIVTAYTINELPGQARDRLLDQLLRASRAGAVILVVEPIAGRLTPWWAAWESAVTGAGGHAGEWRFPADLPGRQRDLARAAGLDVRELTARSLVLPGGASWPEGPGFRGDRIGHSR
jgi:SAM-dependent methyltransferase